MFLAAYDNFHPPSKKIKKDKPIRVVDEMIKSFECYGPVKEEDTYQLYTTDISGLTLSMPNLNSYPGSFNAPGPPQHSRGLSENKLKVYSPESRPSSCNEMWPSYGNEYNAYSHYASHHHGTSGDHLASLVKHRHSYPYATSSSPYGPPTLSVSSSSSSHFYSSHSSSGIERC